MSGVGGSGRGAELVRLRSGPAAWFLCTSSGVRPLWAECSLTCLRNDPHLVLRLLLWPVGKRRVADTLIRGWRVRAGRSSA
jgi:hypothetical protein